MELRIEYVSKQDLKPYANNAKIHTAEQIEQIKRSIKEFGFNDPVAVWHDNEIIEGHGRLLAVMEMDEIQEVPIIRLDNLSDEERRAYMLAHNQLTMNTGFDFALLEEELENLEIDMGEFGFASTSIDSYFDEPEDEMAGGNDKAIYKVICLCGTEQEKEVLTKWLNENAIAYED